MRVIAITGGGQGIGRALAWHFADAGYIVAITDKDRAAGREALAGIKQRGTDGLFLAGDVSKPVHVGSTASLINSPCPMCRSTTPWWSIAA